MICVNKHLNIVKQIAKNVNKKLIEKLKPADKMSKILIL